MFRRYEWDDNALRLTDKVEMEFDQEAFDRDMEADEVGGSIDEYMFPRHNGIQLTREAFQSFSDRALGGIEVILFGASSEPL